MVRYTITWHDPSERLFDITLSFSAPSDNPRLTLPRWRPGRYLLQNYAAQVRDWSARVDGEPREVRKDHLSSWIVEARKGEDVTVRYRFYAGVLDAGSSFLDFDEAYFNGTNLFMMVDALRGEEASLTIGSPADWRVETQLPREDDNTFHARDYDHLIDSPTIAAAQLTRYSIQESGATIHLVFRGDEGIDTEQYVDPVRAIIRTQALMFGGLPLTDYRFLVHIGDRWHGVEHEDSCSIVAKRADMLGAKPGSDGHDHFLSICSHEFFHVWNVKRIVPRVFAPYDYSRETPTRLLWVMEGVTSYFGEMTLVRCGLWDATRYLKHLAQEIEKLESSPAQRSISLSEASFDAWLQRDVHDRANAVVDFYNKGEVVAALLDLTILRETRGAKSLEDVMRILWRWRVLDEDAMEKAVAEVADVGNFFRDYVHGTDALPYEDLFAEVSIRYDSRSRGTPVGLGATVRMENGKVVVASVIRGGSAMHAGLLPGDEVIGIDGNRTSSPAEVDRVLEGLRDGDGVEVMVNRAGTINGISMIAGIDPRVTVTLTAEGESALRDQWLKRTT
jgi:predicted metalloprotease with PDZ domain